MLHSLKKHCRPGMFNFLSFTHWWCQFYCRSFLAFTHFILDSRKQLSKPFPLTLSWMKWRQSQKNCQVCGQLAWMWCIYCTTWYVYYQFVSWFCRVNHMGNHLWIVPIAVPILIPNHSEELHESDWSRGSLIIIISDCVIQSWNKLTPIFSLRHIVDDDEGKFSIGEALWIHAAKGDCTSAPSLIAIKQHLHQTGSSKLLCPLWEMWSNEHSGEVRRTVEPPRPAWHREHWLDKVNS